LAGDAVRAAERHDLLGDVGRAGGAAEHRRVRARSVTGCGSRWAMRVPSMSPGATQLTVMLGASATARQRVRWISAALLAA
jgi:hypothetical protein